MQQKRDQIEALNRELEEATGRLRYYRQKEKIMQREIKRLTRNERTHRLCTRGGMLERFLREPELLTDGDVIELLTFLFRGEAAQKKLEALIVERRKTLETDEG